MHSVDSRSLVMVFDGFVRKSYQYSSDDCPDHTIISDSVGMSASAPPPPLKDKWVVIRIPIREGTSHVGRL